MSDYYSELPSLIDRSVKALFRECPGAVIRLAGMHVEPANIRVEDPNLNLPELRADHVFVIQIDEEAGPRAIYLEYQLEPDANLLPSWCAKWGGLNRQLEMPVILLVLYLQRGDRATFPDHYTVQAGVLETKLTFPVIRLWDHTARIRNGELPELAPLLLLCEETPTEETVREEVALIHAATLPIETQGELLGIALLLASRLFARERLLAIFEEDFEMIQDVGIVGDWLQEREAKGKAIGEAKGKAEGVLETLMLLGRKRFGEPKPDLLEALEAIPSSEVLQQLAIRLLEVENWEELMASATSPARSSGD